MLNTININLKTDIKTDRPTTLPITLMSQDVNNNQFILRFTSDGESVALDDTYTVEVLTKFSKSGTSRLTTAKVRQVYATWEFDTDYIAQDETVYNYVYVRKSGNLVVSADANCFVFSVDLSEIDKGAGKVAETYDENYEKVLHEFEVGINLTKEEWAQMADETRDFVDEIKDKTVDEFVELKMGEELANLESEYATRLTGLETNDANITAQLAQKAGKVEVQQLIGEISDGTPLFADSVANMTDASRLYVNTNDGVVYANDGSGWVNTGVLYQSTGLDNASVLPRHLTTSSTPIVKDQSLYTSSALESTLYIPNETVDAGLINATFSTSAATNGEVYLLEKIGETNNFIVKGKKEHTSVTGENNVSTGLIAEGNGSEYVGLRGFKINFKSDGNPDGFFEKSVYDGTTTPFTATKKTNTFDFSLYITYSDVILSKQVNKIKADIGDLSTSISTPDALKSFNTLKFRETTGNSSIFPNAYFQGRWFVKNIGGIDHICTINAGSEIYAKFTGTTISGVFVKNHTLSPPYIAVSIDGGAFTRILIAGGSVVLASGLEDKEHYIRVIADGIRQDDDVWIGGEGLAFKEFTVSAGKTITAIKPLNKVGLYIGDSITAGIRALSTSSSPGGSSAEKAFPFITCKELNSACVRVGFGSTGVSTVGAGGVPVALTYADYVKSGILENAEKPDYVVINHGTNDNEIDSPTFQSAYRALINRINIKYPGTAIICMRPFNGSHASDISTIVVEFANCFYVDTSSWAVTYNDGVHPDGAGHIVAGKNLATALKKIFGLGYFIV